MDNYLSVIDTIYAVVDYAKGEGDFLNIINTIVDSSVLRRLATDKKTAYIYGKKAGFNPYPTHSYEGVMWIRNNTKYVIAN